jgi:hypothetical protein
MLALASLAVVAAPVAASAQSFGNGHGRDSGGWNNRGDYGRGDRGDRGNGGAVLAAGVFGLILGSAIANSNHAYGYAQPYGYAQRCEWRNQAYDTGYGEIAYRQVEVCR